MKELCPRHLGETVLVILSFIHSLRVNGYACKGDISIIHIAFLLNRAQLYTVVSFAQNSRIKVYPFPFVTIECFDYVYDHVLNLDIPAVDLLFQSPKGWNFWSEITVV